MLEQSKPGNRRNRRRRCVIRVIASEHMAVGSTTCKVRVLAFGVEATGCGGNARTSADGPIKATGGSPSAAGAASTVAGSSAGGTPGSRRWPLACGQPAGGAGQAGYSSNGEGGDLEAGNAEAATPRAATPRAATPRRRAGSRRYWRSGEGCCLSVCSKFSATSSTTCAGIGDLGPTCPSDCSDTFAYPRRTMHGSGSGDDVLSRANRSWGRPSVIAGLGFTMSHVAVPTTVSAYQKCVADSGSALPATLCAQNLLRDSGRREYVYARPVQGRPANA